MNRLYMAESSVSLTGASADHRMAVRTAEVEAIARELAAELGLPVEKSALPASAMAKSIVEAMIKDAKARPTRTLVMVGESQPAFVHALGYAINEKLGSLGKALILTEPVEANPPSAENSIEALSADMAAGKVSALFILGGNPLATATPDSGFAAALKDQTKVALKVRLGLFDDETSEFCHWQIPEAHALEAWSDARAFDGTLSVQQPLIAPLYEGKSAHEVVQALLGDSTTTGYEIVRNAWKPQLGPALGFEKSWRKVVHDGLLPASAFPAVVVKTAPGTWMQTKAASNQGDLDVAFRLDPNILDGRYANNGWMQELPKPLTKLTWDNAALVSPKTAKRLDIPDPEGTARGTFVDRVTLKVGGASVSIPTWVVPGHPDDTVTVYLGAGRKRSGRVGQGVGVDVQPLRVSASPWSRSGATDFQRGHPLRHGLHPGSLEDGGRVRTRPPAHHQLRRVQGQARVREARGRADPAGLDVSRASLQRQQVGHVDRPVILHRLQRLRHRLPEREQHRGGGQRADHARSRNAVAPHRPLLRGRV